jgi:hypothetical protein
VLQAVAIHIMRLRHSDTNSILYIAGRVFLKGGCVIFMELQQFMETETYLRQQCLSVYQLYYK